MRHKIFISINNSWVYSKKKYIYIYNNVTILHYLLDILQNVKNVQKMYHVWAHKTRGFGMNLGFCLHSKSWLWKRGTCNHRDKSYILGGWWKIRKIDGYEKQEDKGKKNWDISMIRHCKRRIWFQFLLG